MTMNHISLKIRKLSIRLFCLKTSRNKVQTNKHVNYHLQALGTLQNASGVRDRQIVRGWRSWKKQVQIKEVE